MQHYMVHFTSISNSGDERSNSTINSQAFCCEVLLQGCPAARLTVRYILYTHLQGNKHTLAIGNGTARAGLRYTCQTMTAKQTAQSLLVLRYIRAQLKRPCCQMSL